MKLTDCYPFADDDRVVPLHSFKHAATLQHLHPKNPHPLLISLETKAGHGSGRSTEQMYVSSSGLDSSVTSFFFARAGRRIVSAADKFAFITHTLGLKWEG